MPPKRTWSQANEDIGASFTSSPMTRPSLSEPYMDKETSAPSISRKVKACAACRKQKIKCIMNEGPPCKRCTERHLSCVLNKSLQTLIEERSEWKHTFISDLGNIHSALQQALTRLDLPALPAMQTTASAHVEASPYEDALVRDDAPSCDNSPRISPRGDAVPHVPIESLYQITRLRALRSDDPADGDKSDFPAASNHSVSDFISNGLVSVEDANRLARFYIDRIDHFMYTIGSGRYRDLESLRRGSPILTACICAVAALHDPMSNHLYGVCKREFQRLMAASMFDRRIDRDHLRAMCIGSYWLHDISWTLSGYAIRRATEVNLSSNYHRLLATGSEESMECMRIWYILYICDHHLSILYGRPSIVREDVSISGWEQVMKTSLFTESDKRLVSQMALLIIMSNVRELFGPDTGEPVAQAFAPQLTNFSRQIDQWMGYWNTQLLSHHQFIGEFPKKGVIVHAHLAKLHLHSHVFRGLKGSSVPNHFQESAAAAVSAATSTIEMLLTDYDIREGLVGLPHYLHSMIAFACVFLLKIAIQHSGQYIEDAVIYDLTSKAVQQFRSTAVGKWHLVHLMADGLEKMTLSRMRPVVAGTTVKAVNGTGGQVDIEHNLGLNSTLFPTATLGEGDFMGGAFGDEFNLGTSSFLRFTSEDLGFNMNGAGF